MRTSVLAAALILAGCATNPATGKIAAGILQDVTFNTCRIVPGSPKGGAFSMPPTDVTASVIAQLKSSHA